MSIHTYISCIMYKKNRKEFVFNFKKFLTTKKKAPQRIKKKNKFFLTLLFI